MTAAIDQLQNPNAKSSSPVNDLFVQYLRRKEAELHAAGVSSVEPRSPLSKDAAKAVQDKLAPKQDEINAEVDDIVRVVSARAKSEPFEYSDEDLERLDSYGLDRAKPYLDQIDAERERLNEILGLADVDSPDVAAALKSRK